MVSKDNHGHTTQNDGGEDGILVSSDTRGDAVGVTEADLEISERGLSS